MKQIIVLLLTIAHGGHLLSGHTESISVMWPAESGLPASILHWECKMGSISLVTGRSDMPDASHPATIRIVVPTVRAETALQFAYQLNAKDGGAALAEGNTEIHVYPDQLPGDFATQFAGKHVVLLDHTNQLSQLLKRAKVKATTIPTIGRIQMQRPDVLIIGADEWSSSPLGQPALEPLARAGTQIIIFRQSEADTVAGFRINRREPKNGMTWRIDHPLLTGLDVQTLSAWAAEMPAMAIQLPVNESALEIGYWNPETSSGLSAPIDALLVTKTLGKGRIILCQCPVDDWSDDPRSQILLHNLLAYITTRPEPTPPPRERRPAVIAPLPHERNIVISPGAQP